jgi:hypothetical protein
MTNAHTAVPNLVHLAYANDVAAPADRVFPLLCPVREYEWIEGWSCQLVHTSSGLVEEGCVFVTHPSDAEGTITWVTTVHDPAARRVAFVRVTEGRRAVRMALHVEPLGAERCRLHIAYDVTGIDTAGREEARRAAETGEPYARIAAGLAAAAERYLVTGRAVGAIPGPGSSLR